MLTERFYSWRDAEEVAKNDPEINLSEDGPIYVPKDFEEEVDILKDLPNESEIVGDERIELDKKRNAKMAEVYKAELDKMAAEKAAKAEEKSA